jgi:Bacterial Ig-like domain (group 2)
MNRNWFMLIIVCAAALCLPSCGHDQQLVSITITPSGFVFEGVGAQGQFTALGTYIHPPVTKDITNQVVWKIDVANLATITQTGLVTGLSVCGSGDVTATHYSNPANPTAGTLIVGTATVKGVDDGTPKCMP